MVDQIAVLRQVFDYFDKDKTGQIDASEMDAVLLKLGVKLSKEAFDKMLKDADLDSNYLILLLSVLIKMSKLLKIK